MESELLIGEYKSSVFVCFLVCLLVGCSFVSLFVCLFVSLFVCLLFVCLFVCLLVAWDLIHMGRPSALKTTSQDTHNTQSMQQLNTCTQRQQTMSNSYKEESKFSVYWLWSSLCVFPSIGRRGIGEELINYLYC